MNSLQGHVKQHNSDTNPALQVAAVESSFEQAVRIQKVIVLSRLDVNFQVNLSASWTFGLISVQLQS